MKNILNNFLKTSQNIETGNFFFLLGVFFLPSALPIGLLFLLISVIFSFRNKKNKFINDIWDKLLIVCILLILLSTLYTCYLNTPYELISFNKSIIWLNLFNWVPIIIFYFGFKNYLLNIKQKVLFEKYLISGTFPVLVSCIM